MASPITWRSVNGPSLSDAARPLQLATQNFGSAFDKLGSVLAQREAANGRVEERGIEDSKNAYLDTLQGARTPEELAALRMSGVLDQRLQAMDPRARAAVRGAEEARMGSLRQQLTAGQAFDDAALARTEAPIRDAYRSAVYGNDEAAQAQIRAANPNIKDWASLLKEDSEVERRFVEQSRADRMAPITEANAIAQGQLTGVQLKSARKAADDQALVDNVVGGRLKAFTNTNEQHAMGLASLAEQFGLPLDPGGLPDTSGLDATQLEAFGKAMKDANLTAPPTASQARKQVRDALIAQGASPTAIAQATAVADQTFAAKGALSAEDQGTINQRTAQIDDMEVQARAKNLFYTPPKELNQVKTDVLGKVDKLITDGPMTKTALRTKMNVWMDRGIEITKGGKTLTVPVPPKVVEAALMAGLESDTWGWNNTDNKMEKIIKNIMTSKNYDDQRVEADWLLADGHKRAKKEFEDKIRSSAGTVTPADFLSNFNNTLTRKRAEAKPK